MFKAALFIFGLLAIIQCKPRHKSSRLQTLVRNPQSWTNAAVFLAADKRNERKGDVDFVDGVGLFQSFAERHRFTSVRIKEDANRETILEEVERGARLAGEDGTYLLVIRGHGSRLNGSIGTTSSRFGLKEMIAAMVKGRVGYQQGKGRALVVLDSCYSGKNFAELDLEKIESGFGQTIYLSAASENQVASQGELLARLNRIYDQSAADISIGDYLLALKAIDPKVLSWDGKVYRHRGVPIAPEIQFQLGPRSEPLLGESLKPTGQRAFDQRGLIRLWNFYNYIVSDEKEFIGRVIYDHGEILSVPGQPDRPFSAIDGYQFLSTVYDLGCLEMRLRKDFYLQDGYLIGGYRKCRETDQGRYDQVMRDLRLRIDEFDRLKVPPHFTLRQRFDGTYVSEFINFKIEVSLDQKQKPQHRIAGVSDKVAAAMVQQMLRHEVHPLNLDSPFSMDADFVLFRL